MNVLVWRGLDWYLMDETLVLPTDYLKATDGSVQAATNFPQFAHRFRRPDPMEDLIKLGVIVGAAYVAWDLLREGWNSRFPPYNGEPLSGADRAYVRERDGETCYYCRVWAPDGHVDHM